MVYFSKKTIQWLIAHSCFALFFYQQSFAFTLVSDTIGWGKSSITFDIDTSCSSYSSIVQTVIGDALSFWNNVPSANLTLSIGGTSSVISSITTYFGTSATSDAPAGNPIVYCDTSFNSNSGGSGDSIPGLATAFNIDSSTKQLLGGIIVLNFESTAQASLTNLSSNVATIVLAHEIGHILGLGHSGDTKALMYYSTGSGRALRLAKDDLDGITYLYPRQEGSGAKAFGCASTTTHFSNQNRKHPDHDQNFSNPSQMEFISLLIVLALICFRHRIKFKSLKT